MGTKDENVISLNLHIYTYILLYTITLLWAVMYIDRINKDDTLCSSYKHAVLAILLLFRLLMVDPIKQCSGRLRIFPRTIHQVVQLNACTQSWDWDGCSFHAVLDDHQGYWCAFCWRMKFRGIRSMKIGIRSTMTLNTQSISPILSYLSITAVLIF